MVTRGAKPGGGESAARSATTAFGGLFWVGLVALCGGCVDEVRAPFDAQATVGELDTSVVADTIGGDATTDAAADAVADTTPVVEPLPVERATVVSRFEGAAIWAGVAGPGALLVADGATWWWLDGGGAREVTPAPGDAGDALAAPPRAVAGARRRALVGRARGRARAARGRALAETPLAAMFAADPVEDLRAGGGSVWVASGEALWRLRAGAIARVAPGGLASGAARLAWGPPAGGTPALWVAAGGGVYALADGAAGLAAWPEQPLLAATALAASGDGTLWAVTDEGAWRRTSAAVWWELALPEAPVAVVGGADGAWLAAADGRLFHAVGAALSEIENAPAGTFWGPGPDGTLLVAGSSGVAQVAPGRVLRVEGLKRGVVLEATATVAVRPSQPGEVEAVAATIDGAAAEVVEGGEGEARTFTVTVDPHALESGAHELAVTVTWADATLAERLPFSVDHVTWADDIGPLYVSTCANCHNAVDGASTAVLDTPAAWRSRIDCVVCRVSYPYDPSLAECLACDDTPSTMPPTGPLPSSEAELIREWRRDGLR
ncbi:MAG: hypothetical protein H6745_09675 [Deltaproteobacteria bacterium]|nr:hypothetical protein [Deltaproteobacteria bacterium]